MNTETEIDELIEGMHDLFFAVDQDWAIIRANKSFYETTNSKPETQLGKNFLQLYLNYQGAKESNYWILYHLAMKDRVSICFEDFHEPSGYRTLVTVFPRKEGGLNVFVKDYSLKTKLELSEKLSASTQIRFQTFFEQSPISTQIFSPAGKTLQVNSAWKRLWNVPEDVIQDVVLKTYNIFEDQPLIEKGIIEYIKKGFSGIACRLPIVELNPNEVGVQGDKRWIEGYIYPVVDQDGKISEVILNHVDVTDLVNSKEKVVTVASQLQETIESLEKEREIRETFVAALSHDLRTPLTAAKLSSDVLSRKLTDHPEMYKAAHRISQNMDRADVMIRDLLDASYINAGEKLQLRIQYGNFKKILNGVLEDLSGIHGEKFVVTSNKDLEGYWDTNGVVRILENLLNNAIKYGDIGSKVSIEYSMTDDRLIFSVHNRGQPIPESEFMNLFSLFKRSDKAQKSGQKGWGLGLTLVQGIAQSHGGKVSVSSNHTKGTTFTIELPLDARSLQDN